MDNSYQFYIGFSICQPEPFDGVVVPYQIYIRFWVLTTPCKGAGTNRTMD